LRHLTQCFFLVTNSFAGKGKLVVIAEYSNLIRVKQLISNSLMSLELLESKEGNLFLSSSAKQPEGFVCFATTPALFCRFLEGLVTLQTLLDQSPSRFIEINGKDKTTLYSRNDMEVILTSGDKTIRELTDSCPIEIW